VSTRAKRCWTLVARLVVVVVMMEMHWFGAAMMVCVYCFSLASLRAALEARGRGVWWWDSGPAECQPASVADHGRATACSPPIIPLRRPALACPGLPCQSCFVLQDGGPLHIFQRAAAALSILPGRTMPQLARARDCP
jgi:hypothetical protein